MLQAVNTRYGWLAKMSAWTLVELGTQPKQCALKKRPEPGSTGTTGWRYKINPTRVEEPVSPARQFLVLEDCLAGLTDFSNSTRAETCCTDLQLIGSRVVDCQTLTWPDLIRPLFQEWKEDSALKVRCDNNDGGGGGDDEPCASGEQCRGCNVWSEVNGVLYCCKENCNSGSISVEEDNGIVTCHCRH